MSKGTWVTCCNFPRLCCHLLWQFWLQHVFPSMPCTDHAVSIQLLPGSRMYRLVTGVFSDSWTTLPWSRPASKELTRSNANRGLYIPNQSKGPVSRPHWQPIQSPYPQVARLFPNVSEVLATLPSSQRDTPLDWGERMPTYPSPSIICLQAIQVD